MNLNWQAIGAVSELIGALAVMCSLLYVAREIRLNTSQVEREIEMQRLAAHERNAAESARTRELFLLHPELSALYIKGSRDLSTLHGVDKFQFDQLLRIIFLGYQTAFARHSITGSDLRDFQGANRQIDQLLRLPGVREWISTSQFDWRPEFESLIKERLKSSIHHAGE